MKNITKWTGICYKFCLALLELTICQTEYKSRASLRYCAFKTYKSNIWLYLAQKLLFSLLNLRTMIFIALLLYVANSISLVVPYLAIHSFTFETTLVYEYSSAYFST